MKLMTKELEKRFAAVGSQEKIADPIIIAKFFYPAGSATWYATEYNPEDQCFFGLADLFGDGGEIGYFSREELQTFRGQFGLGIERDLHFGEKKLSEVRK